MFLSMNHLNTKKFGESPSLDVLKFVGFSTVISALPRRSMGNLRPVEIADSLQFGSKSIGVLGSVAVLLNNILGSLGEMEHQRK